MDWLAVKAADIFRPGKDFGTRLQLQFIGLSLGVLHQ